MLKPPVNGKIQGFSRPLSVFSSTFQGKFYFQGLFKTALSIQVLFMPVRTLYNKAISLNPKHGVKLGLVTFTQFKPNGLSNPYQLDKSIFNLRDVLCYFFIFIKILRIFCKQIVKMLMLQPATPDQGLQHLPKSHKKDTKLHSEILWHPFIASPVFRPYITARMLFR